LGDLARLEGDFAVARARLEEMLRYFRQNGNLLGLAVALHDLGELAEAEGDYPAARVYLLDSLARRRDIGDKSGIATALAALGNLARVQGESSEARALLEEALSIFRVTGRWEIGDVLASLGEVARMESDLARAIALLRESLARLRIVGEKRQICHSLCLIALVEVEQGAHGRALPLFAAAMANAPRGGPLEPAERRPYDDALAASRAALGEEAYAAAWAEGRAMNLEQAIAYALGEQVEG
jgi:tetratricopeptide (TPR) repeat protein